MSFNIFASVGTSEVDLAPYPGGSAKVQSGVTRRIYIIVLSNSATSSNTITFRIYKGTTVDTSVSIVIPASSTITIVGNRDSPVLLVPSDRTLKAVATAASVNVFMAGYDK